MSNQILLRLAQLMNKIALWLYKVSGVTEVVGKVEQTDEIKQSPSVSEEDSQPQEKNGLTTNPLLNPGIMNRINKDLQIDESGQQREQLIRECADLMNELDTYIPKAEAKTAQFLEYTLSRLEDALDRSHVEKIEDEQIFNPVRHRSQSSSPTPQGTSISETIRPGYVLGNRVIRRALVKTKTLPAQDE
jgi:molecular chaperone GrpE (heat shock protein)